MTSDRSAVVQTRDLRKEYGSTVAVDDVSLEIYDGEIFALLGPNGAGKTTAVELIQGLREPTSGEVTLFGQDLQNHLRALKDRLGVVPQSFHTFERLTVRENVALIGDLHSASSDVDEVLAELDLTEWAGERFGSLSGGYKRRTGIAMALVSEPDILFLDEPTAGLDPAARRATWEHIEGLPELGTTVVLTTHYMDEVEYLADRVALLVDGHVEAVDSVPALVDAYAGEVTVVVHLAGGEPEAELESTLESRAQAVHRREGALVGVFDDRQRAQEAYSALQDIGTHSIDLVSPGMEDVFLELAGASLAPGGELR
jgi:ABC-2 type transport system ATP-binding protein